MPKLDALTFRIRQVNIEDGVPGSGTDCAAALALLDKGWAFAEVDIDCVRVATHGDLERIAETGEPEPLRTYRRSPEFAAWMADYDADRPVLPRSFELQPL